MAEPNDSRSASAISPHRLSVCEMRREETERDTVRSGIPLHFTLYSRSLRVTYYLFRHRGTVNKWFLSFLSSESLHGQGIISIISTNNMNNIRRN